MHGHAKETVNLLTTKQVQQLIRLPIPVVVPVDTPVSFRVTRVDAETGKYANGDDDSGYNIDYRNNSQTCFTVASSQSGPRGLQQVGQVATAFGRIKIYTESPSPAGANNFAAFIPVVGNPLLLTPGYGKPDCKSLGQAEFERVLRSIVVLKK
ncbi:hypothetical protein [Cyanobium sp. ATX-6F1]|uniref:hypothetical protein n=1 Tax=Cyanobium sp. ATX-6F1 TaxID=3137388 RepID=UPI0039BE954B